MIPPSRVRVPAPTIGHSLAAAGGALAVFVTACLIPDTGIVLSGDQNSNAVKILERAGLTDEFPLLTSIYRIAFEQAPPQSMIEGMSSLRDQLNPKP